MYQIDAVRLGPRCLDEIGDVRFGSKADMCSAQAHVRFTPESDIKCDIVECPLRAKSGHSFEHLVGTSDKRVGDIETERPRGLEVDAQLDFRALLDRQFAGLFAFKNSSNVDAR